MPRIVDLTAMGDPAEPLARVKYEPLSTMAESRINITRIVTDSHAGTHMDAPLHMVAGGCAIHATSLETCIGPATVLSLTDLEGRAIEADALERVGKDLLPECRALLYTGWENEWGKPRYREDHPYIAPSGAEWLVDKRVRLVGVDFPSVGPLDDKENLIGVHQILLRPGIVLVECLMNLSLLPEQVEFIALPLKLMGVDGSPVRAIARVP